MSARTQPYYADELTRLKARATIAEADAKALREALTFYADKQHFALSEADAWDTVSGEPQNLWCDEAGTATIEDGSIARRALARSLCHSPGETNG